MARMLERILLRVELVVKLMVMGFMCDLELSTKGSLDSPTSPTTNTCDPPATENALAEAADLVINTIARSDEYIVMSVKKINGSMIEHRHYCSDITMLPLFLLRLEKITESVIEERTDTDDSD